MDKFGLTPEEAGDGSPDLLWLREPGDGTFSMRSDELPFEIEVSLAASTTTSCSGSRASEP